MREKSTPEGQLPASARSAQTACTRARTSANRWSAGAFSGLVSGFFSGFFSAMSRRLTQFRGRVKKPLMLDQREAVGHARDKIADPPRPRALGLVLRAFQPFGRQIGGAFLVSRKQVGHR